MQRSFPEIIAHRGASREYRENTMDAFNRALELGVDGIELDVHLSRDGQVVVHHDPAVQEADAPNDAPLAIVEATFARIRRASPGVEIPLLNDVLSLVGCRAKVYVELKASNMEAEVATVIRASAALCAVHAFDHRVIRRMREFASEIPRGILLSSYLVDVAPALRSAGATDLWQHWTQVDSELVAVAATAGARVIAWTSSDADDARELAGIGVAGICTDDPELVRRAVHDGTHR